MNINNKHKNALLINILLILIILTLIVLLIPIFKLAPIDRATGDDFGYSYRVRTAYMSGASLIEIIKASVATNKQFYYGWQGTWFDIFLFSIQPECFSTKAYVIVPFLSIFAWLGSTLFLFKQIFFKYYKLTRSQYLLISLLFWITSMEFIPGTKSSIFWYNGCSHYIYPFSICQIAIGLLIIYLSDTNKRYLTTLIGFSILMTLIGGGNYQVALLALIATIFLSIYSIIVKKNDAKKKTLLLTIPVILECVGLYFSITAPGNRVRGGEDLSFSLSLFITTIFKSFQQAFIDGIRFMSDNPIQVYVMLLILVLLIIFFSFNDSSSRIKMPILTTLLLICTYVAMETPLIYVQVNDASQGSNNTNYQIFYLVMLGIITIWTSKIVHIGKDKVIFKLSKPMLITTAVLGLFVISVFRSSIRTSTSYECYDYISTGQAADFKTQMLQLDELLSTDEPNPVVPFINDQQGPLMHMPITADSTAWTNSVTAKYYGKETITAIDRNEWNEKYGNSR